jgi:hypothetical protein
MDIRARSPIRPVIALVAGLALVLAACGVEPELALPSAAPGPDDDVAEGADDVDEAAEDAPAEDMTDGVDDPEAGDGPAEDEADGPDDPDHGTQDADCSGQGAVTEARSVDGMPAEVAAARDFLLDAARRCDEQLLFTAIEESEQFTYSFGATGDAIGYWWELEEAGEQPFLRLAQVLSTTPSTLEDGDLWVWPQVHTGRTEDTTDAAWAELTWLEDPEATRSAGEGYLDWRVGITADGQWRFFVRGD